MTSVPATDVKEICNSSDALRMPLLLTTLLGVYVIQSMVGMFAFQGIPAILRAEGLSTAGIGLMYLIMLPWALKFLWAPVVERYRQSRANFMPYVKISLAGNVLLAALFVSLIFLSHTTLGLFFCLLFMAFVSTLVDICNDGFAIDQLAAKNHGLANIMQVGGSYIGAMIGGGVFIFLVSVYNWPIALYLLAAMVVLMSLPVGLLSNKSPSAPLVAKHRKARPSLALAWQDSSIRKTLYFVCLSQFGTRVVLSMMMPFFIDQGVRLADLGLLAAGGGAPAGIFGAFIGGVLVRQLGVAVMLRSVLIVELICFSVFILFSYGFIPRTIESSALFGLYIFTSIVIAAKFVVMYTLMMNRSKGGQSGVNFTLFQSADMAVAIITALVAGWVIAQFGYSTHFLLAIFITGASLMSVLFYKSLSDFNVNNSH